MRVVFPVMLLTLAFAVPAPSTAQALRPTPAQYAAAGALQPRLAPPAADAAPRTAAVYVHGSRHEGSVLMVVGLAGIVTGLLVDEPVVTIISAGVGGLGLYLYLR